MPSTCAAISCVQRQKKGSSVSFHKFPKDDDLRRKWVVAMRRDKWSPTVRSRLCSEHFEAGTIREQNGYHYVMEGAVPSVFNFPPHMRKPSPKRRPVVRRNLELEDFVQPASEMHFEKDQYQKHNSVFLKRDAVPTIFFGDRNKALPEEEEASITEQVKAEEQPVRDVEDSDKINDGDKDFCCICAEWFPPSDMLSLWVDSGTQTHFGRILYKLLNLAQFEVALQYCCSTCSRDVLTCFKLMIQINVGAILTNRGHSRLPLPLPEALDQGCHLCGTVFPTVEEFAEHITEHVTSGTEHLKNNADTASDFCGNFSQEVKLECNDDESEEDAFKDFWESPIPEESPATELDELKHPREATDESKTKGRKEKKRKGTVRFSLPETQTPDFGGSPMAQESLPTERNVLKRKREATDEGKTRTKIERILKLVEDCEVKDTQKTGEENELLMAAATEEPLSQLEVIDELEVMGALSEGEICYSSDSSEPKEPYSILEMKDNHASLLKDEHCYTKSPADVKKTKVRRTKKPPSQRIRKAPKYGSKEKVCCDICGRLFAKSGFKLHLEHHRKHPDGKHRKESTVPKAEKWNPQPSIRKIKREKLTSLTCEHCGVDFDRSFFLVNHLVVCHGESMTETAKPWKCGVCAIEMSGLKAFRKHCREEHNGEGFVKL